MDNMNNSQISQNELIRIVIPRYLGAFLVMSAIFFLPVGTLAYWEAWVYLSMFFLAMLLVGIYIIKNKPELLVRRMRIREKEAEQKLIVKIISIPFLLAFLLPGFDKRFGWSNVPQGVVVLRIFWY